MARPLVAVHAGAGYHNDSNGKELKVVCMAACKEAMKVMRDGKGCNEAIAVAISILEDSPLTNAGLGSNLTLTGTVECDASIMDGHGGFGAVGSLQGVVNPIKVAQKLLEQSSQGCLPLGRVPPVVLAGEGAYLWAKQQDIPTCNPNNLIIERAREVYLDHKSRLDKVTEPAHKRRRTEDDLHPSPQPGLHAPLDTVGAICVNGCGEVSAGVSSGGISLKFPGRIGQAAMFGCGCWADNSAGNDSAVACSTSGTGEYIIKSLLARECAIATVDRTLHTVLNEKFLHSKFLENADQKLAGVIALNVHPTGGIHFSWGHTTETMCIGYMCASQKEPVAFISKLNNVQRAGKTVQVGGIGIDV